MHRGTIHSISNHHIAITGTWRRVKFQHFLPIGSRGIIQA